ncbi:MAG: hypothetical protein ACFCU9_09590 [Cyanophyceae cyanobacterium]
MSWVFGQDQDSVTINSSKLNIKFWDGDFNLSLAPVFLNQFSEGIIEIEVPEKICDPDEFGTWANSIAFPAPIFPDPPEWKKYEAYRCGNIQYKASVGDVSVNADGADVSSCRLLDCKYTTGEPIALYVKCGPDFIIAETEDEFVKYGNVISDPNTPAVGLLVITNKDASVPCLTQLLTDRVSKFSISVQPEEPQQA